MVAYSTCGGRLPWSKGPTLHALDRDVPVAKQVIRYCCPRGHEFERPFAADADPPVEWDCPQHGSRSPRFGLVLAPLPEPRKGTRSKTHKDHLDERRTVPELQQLLDEALADRTKPHDGSPVAPATTNSHGQIG